MTFAQIKEKVKKLSVSQKSTLVLEGEDIVLEDVTLDGALVVKAGPNSKVKFLQSGGLLLSLYLLEIEFNMDHLIFVSRLFCLEKK